MPQTMMAMADTTMIVVSGHEVMSTGKRKLRGEKKVFDECGEKSRVWGF